MPDVGRAKFEYRGISPDVAQRFGIFYRLSEDGERVESIAFRYSNDGTWKIRSAENKDATRIVHGTTKFQDCGLFGQALWNAGGSDSITITEGEFDAPSVFQMVGQPAVSVKSGASGAKRDVQKHFEYLNSFNRIVLCFDGDVAGRRAIDEVAPLFDNRKLYVVSLTKHKDPNEFLEAGDIQEFRNAWHNARRYVPDGVVSGFNEVAMILKEGPKKADATYPFEELQAMTYGLRTGEMVLVTAPEGVGKTEFIRKLEHHILKTTNHCIGIIHLEENQKRTIHGLLTYELEQPIFKEDTHVSVEDQLDAYKKLVRTEDRCYVYAHYGSDDPHALLNIVRFLVAVCDCKFVFLDHLTMVPGADPNVDERKILAFLSTELSKMVRELDFCLVVVNHINDEGLALGSRLISKLNDIHIRLERDPISSDTVARNKTKLVILKNRTIGDAGPAGEIFFDNVTHTLRKFETEEGRLP